MQIQTKRISAALLAAILLAGSTQALFGLGSRKEERAPEADAPTAQDLSITTYRGIPYAAELLAASPVGSDLTFAVVDAPKKGVVSVDGANFVYTPKDNASGADRFTYAATDAEGRVSAPATVTVTIEKTRSGVTYADVDEATATAAQWMAEAGVFTGSKLGDLYCFEPERTVSRSEFTAMVLETAGREVSAVTMTGFCDDDAIPVWARAYAAAGVADGVIRGSRTAEGVAFRGADAVTFNEAATILNRVLDMGDVELEVWFADREATPSWAAQAVGNMEALSVMSVGSFGSGALDEAVTRADAAQMLHAARTLLDGQAKTGWAGLW